MMSITGRFGIVAATAGAAVVLLAGCGGAASDSDGASDAPASPSASTAQTDAAAVDCTAVGEVLRAWLEASFSGASTKVTSGEVAAQYKTAAEAFDAAPPPGGEQWDDLGAVIDEYVAKWSAIPADKGALENVEAVESHVDAFAAARGFDNDDFDDMTPVVGEKCAGELEGMFSG